MRVHVNGEERRVAPLTTLRQLLGDAPAPGVAVAVNGEVVPRSRLQEHVLGEDDVVEVVTAVQGG